MKMVGKIIKYSQYLESHLTDLLDFYYQLNYSEVEAINLINNHQKSTLGDLVREVVAFQLVDKDFKKDLWGCINARNKIVHELYIVPKFNSIFSRTKIVLTKIELKGILFKLKQLDKSIVKKNKKYYKELKRK